MAEQKDKAPGKVEQAAQGVASKAVGSSVASKIAGSAAGKALGAVLGSIAPLIGNLIGAILGDFIVKGLTRVGKEVGKAIGKAPFMLVSAVSQLASTIAASIAQALGATFSLVLAVAVILVFFISFVLFIINSGAYIVPPGQLSSSADSTPANSQYIDVVKTATPSGPFQNSRLPLTVSYRIDIKAVSFPLTNIRFSYRCTVISTNGSVACPPDPTLPVPPQQIVTGDTFSITYSMTYNDTYKDSLITDYLEVTADAGSFTNQKSTGVASIIIGSPPTGCFVFDEGGDGWSVEDRSQMTQAIARMSRASGFMAQLCAPELGPILMTYYTTDPLGCAGCGGRIRNWSRHLWFFRNAFFIGSTNTRSLSETEFTLSHESGHVLDASTGLRAQYLAYPGIIAEQPICTYPFGISQYENFAEAIADYLNPDFTGNYVTCLGGTMRNFQTQYPIHWQFVHDFIMLGDNLEW